MSGLPIYGLKSVWTIFRTNKQREFITMLRLCHLKSLVAIGLCRGLYSLSLSWLLIALDFLAVFFIMLRSKFGGNLLVEGGVADYIFSLSISSLSLKNCSRTLLMKSLTQHGGRYPELRIRRMLRMKSGSMPISEKRRLN